MIKVVHHLSQAGLIETIRGRNGGMRLARPASDIGLGDVVRATEPSLALVECQAGEPCAIGGVCRLQGIMDEATRSHAGGLRSLQLGGCHRAGEPSIAPPAGDFASDGDTETALDKRRAALALPLA